MPKRHEAIVGAEVRKAKSATCSSLAGVLQMGTIVLEMSAISPDDPGAVLFGQTRRAILSLTYTRPDESFYLREIVRRTGSAPGAVQRELALLAGSGILRKERNKYYQANPRSPVFEPLKQLVIRTLGIGTLLRQALEGAAADIVVAFIFGSFARGKHDSQSDVDVMVIGRDSEVVTLERIALRVGPTQSLIGREINPFVLPAVEFREKWWAGNHFIRRVTSGEKIFLIGAEDELKRVVEKRLAQTAQDKPQRNRRLTRARRP